MYKYKILEKNISNFFEQPSIGLNSSKQISIEIKLKDNISIFISKSNPLITIKFNKNKISTLE